MYILLEGIDTCGKSTQMELLLKNYPQLITTHEPGGTKFGLKAREILLTDSISSKRAEILLFLTDRAEHYYEIVKPNLNKTVVSDRGFLSGIGYAMANGDFDFEELVELNKFALEGNFPDKVILFMIDIKTLEKRTKVKTLDEIELRGLEYLLRVQAHMRESLVRLDIPHMIVDASDDIDKIHKDIVEYIDI